MARILVATGDGLHEVGTAGALSLGGRAVDALALSDRALLAIVDAQSVIRGDGRDWTDVARLEQWQGRCLLAAGHAVVVGTSEAHLVDAEAGKPIGSFDAIPSRDEWYTPWGGPPDVRSLAADQAGGWWVNVHVGGVWHSPDAGDSWHQRVEVDADVHEVAVDPASGTVAVAAAIGYGQSRDGGASWTWVTDGLHADYCRAVAFTGSHVLLSASTGPSSRQAAVYRRPLMGDAPFERCRAGLPEWFHANVDTGCLAGGGGLAALGTDGGEVYVSGDEGESWELVAKGLPPVRALAVA